MNSQQTNQFDQRARDILSANDRGGFTVPTSRLYPFQWNWDSAFSALGFATFDRLRAWREIDTLLDGQWDNGMLPHIVFRRDDPDYFPGPTVWRSPHSPPTSCHSQPPVLASIVAELVTTGGERDLARARAIFTKILHWHRWYHSARDPDRSGVIAAIHPWETGRDNSPDWDTPMSRVDTAHPLAYTRRDTDHINAEQRPSGKDYDRFINILMFGRSCGWDDGVIATAGPFWTADPGITFILLRADRDLLTLASLLDEREAEREINRWIVRTETGVDQLWNDALGSYCSRDLRSGELGNGISNASLLAYYAGICDPEKLARLDRHCERICAAVRYAMPSWDPETPAFEPLRYWRGPVWLIMNRMIATGLREQGRVELAERITRDSAALVLRSGFYEYFCPLTGTGCGGNDFSWTAAMWLTFASPTHASGLS